MVKERLKIKITKRIVCRLRVVYCIISLLGACGGDSPLDALVLLDGRVVFDGSPAVAHVSLVALTINWKHYRLQGRVPLILQLVDTVSVHLAAQMVSCRVL
jgi:hypothetical protein